MGGLDGDKVVALLGLVMALALVSQSGTLRRLNGNERLKFGAIWLAIFAGGAILVSLVPLR